MNVSVLQLSYSLQSIEMGPAILLIGMLALLLAAGIAFRNPLGLVLWGFTILLFIFSGLFGVGIELVWIGMIMTTVLIIIGLVARAT